jgi:hypothetical protein
MALVVQTAHFLVVVVVGRWALDLVLLLAMEPHTLEQHTAVVVEAVAAVVDQVEMVVAGLLQHHLQMEVMAVQAEQTQVVAVVLQVLSPQTLRLHQVAVLAVQES